MNSQIKDAEVLDRVRAARDLLNQILQLSGQEVKSSNSGINERKVTSRKLDYSMPIRPFMKAHSVGLSGSQKFALLVAYLVKGDEQKSISLTDVKKEWQRMTEIMGEFNGAHTGRARNDDLVSTEKAGLYKLRPNWTSIFQ